MLHTVNKSPFEKNSLASCLRLAKTGSVILLTEDAVYAAISGSEFSLKLEDVSTKFSIYVLEPDLKARGLGNKPLATGIQKTDYDGFVDLVCEQPVTQTWF